MADDAPGEPDGRLLLDEPAPDIARLTISRPRKAGALNQAMLDTLVTTLDSLQARCVILTGEGGRFSAGYDLTELQGAGFDSDFDRLESNPFTVGVEALAAYPHPTIAALSGDAIGGALELALACDLRIAAAPIRMGMPPVRLGLVYPHRGLRRFVDAIGAARTRELFHTARRIDAATALQWGLVNAVRPAEELPAAAIALAEEIVAGAPLAQSGIKTSINALVESSGELADETAAELLALRRDSVASDDVREAMQARIDKRAPRWRGR